MNHENKNQLLTLFYHEGTEREEKKIASHVRACESCQEYLKIVKQTDELLNQWRDEQPLPQTLDLILANVSSTELKPIQARQVFSATPILQIAFSLGIILTLLYFVQSKISLLPIWHSLERWWLVQAIGSFGVVTILFFCIGTFITLSLTPILVFKTNKLNSAISY
jgi:hypothetical protein